jgi:hypothetical protein
VLRVNLEALCMHKEMENKEPRHNLRLNSRRKGSPANSRVAGVTSSQGSVARWLQTDLDSCFPLPPPGCLLWLRCTRLSVFDRNRRCLPPPALHQSQRKDEFGRKAWRIRQHRTPPIYSKELFPSSVVFVPPLHHAPAFLGAPASPLAINFFSAFRMEAITLVLRCSL